MCKRAVILAGGIGKRLYPYTSIFPKPLLPIGNNPILQIIIEQLISFNFTHITLAVNHQAELIKTFFGDGSRFGIKIDYSLEIIPLSTIGPLGLIKDLPDNFLIMNGDILTDLNFMRFYDEHLSGGNIFSVAGYMREIKSEYGVLELNDESNLINFKEKPIFPLIVSMGVYIANKKIIDLIPHNVAYGFDHLMLDLIKIKKPAKVFLHNGYWQDIGRPDDYLKAISDFEEKKLSFYTYESK